MSTAAANWAITRTGADLRPPQRDVDVRAGWICLRVDRQLRLDLCIGKSAGEKSLKRVLILDGLGADRRAVALLSADHPRRRVSLPQLDCLKSEKSEPGAVLQPAGLRKDTNNAPPQYDKRFR
jgi:hypothetical protein